MLQFSKSRASVFKTAVIMATGIALAATCCIASMPVDQAQAATAKPAKVKSVKATATSSSSIKITWKKVKGAKGYQIRVSKSSNMKKAKTCTAKGAKKKSKKISKLSSCTKYYVQVRAYKSSKLKGKWSKKAAVTTKHALKAMAAKAPTCTQAGWKAYYACAKCSYSTKVIIAPTGHDVEVSKEAVEATCTADGSTAEEACKTCGAIVIPSTTIPAKGHVEVVDDAIAPTCTADGKTEGTHCLVCNEVLEAPETIAKIGHLLDTVAAQEATCTTNGHSAGEFCRRCNTMVTPITVEKAPGHAIVTQKAVASTCTTRGKTAGSYCSTCGMVFKYQMVTSATGHSWKEETLREPTADKKGVKLFTCINDGCAESFTVDIPVAEKTHNVGTDVTVLVAPTCLSEGIGKVGCSCGTQHTIYINKTSHRYHEVEAVKATCDTPGHSAYQVCTECGDIQGYEEDPSGHKMVNHELQFATCEINGHSEYQSCSRCGMEVGKTVFAARGHHYQKVEARTPSINHEGYAFTHYRCVFCSTRFDLNLQPILTSSVEIPRIVKDRVEDYKWSQLAEIAYKIAHTCKSQEEAIQIAKEYKLVNEDGKLTGNETKSFELTLNGRTYTVYAQILGFFHDVQGNGQKAGITMGLKEYITGFPMYNASDNAGGWKNSLVRKELNSTVYNALPAELKYELVSVNKMTNNVGVTSSADSVTATYDTLWLLSKSEISFAGGEPVLKAEGTKYQLYNDNPTSAFKKNSYGGGYSFYWLRSPVYSSRVKDANGFATFYCVSDTTGGTSTNFKANEGLGISFCFCIG